MSTRAFEAFVTVRVAGTVTDEGNHTVMYSDVNTVGVSLNTNLAVASDTASFAQGTVDGLLRHGGKQ